MKKHIVALFLLSSVVGTAFASITLPATGIAIPNAPEGGNWIVDDRTEFTREKGMGIIDVPHDIINNCYLTPLDADYNSEGQLFMLLNECTGMDFAFQWSVIRILTVKETRNEMKRFYDMRLNAVNGRNLKILKEEGDNRKAEFYFRYRWETEDGKRVDGYTAGIYYNKETLITLTLEWRDSEGKRKAKEAFESLKSAVGLSYNIEIE